LGLLRIVDFDLVNAFFVWVDETMMSREKRTFSRDQRVGPR
jgi:hypothetical protein